MGSQLLFRVAYLLSIASISSEISRHQNKPIVLLYSMMHRDDGTESSFNI